MPVLRWLTAIGALVVVAACSAPAAPPTIAPELATAADPITGDISVFAAASLTEAFNDLARAFQRRHPTARVVLSFGGSSQLATQLVNGARADVFASADEDQMDVAQRGNALVGDPQVFVTNRLMLITPRDNPAGVSALKDLARPGIKIVGAQASVPIGAYTAALLANANANPNYGSDFQRNVEQNIVSREDTVRQIVAKVQLGEADAAVVYATDVPPAVANQFATITLPEELQVIAPYPIAVTIGRNRLGGEAFVAFVLSKPGQEILARWGFLPAAPAALKS